jgi:hypothetical protein
LLLTEEDSCRRRVHNVGEGVDGEGDLVIDIGGRMAGGGEGGGETLLQRHGGGCGESIGFSNKGHDEKYSKRRDGLMSLIWPFGSTGGERPHVHPSLAAEKLLVEANAAIMNAPR